MLDAEAVAGRAGARGVVEREEPGFKLCEAVAAKIAGEAVGKDDLFLRRIVHPGNPRDAVGDPESRLERLCQPQPDVVLHPKSIHDSFYRVLPAQVEFWRLVQFIHFAVDTGANEALRQEVLHQLHVFALAVVDDGRQQHQSRALGHGQYLVDHLAHGLSFQRRVVVRAAGDAGAGKQQAQVIVYLRHRSHGRARVVRCGFLFDGDRGRQTVDMVDVGLFHHGQELSCIGRQRLDVATLPLRVNRVECKRGLAGTGQAREDDQFIARQAEIEIAQVVRARAADIDGFHEFGESLPTNLLIYAAL